MSDQQIEQEIQAAGADKFPRITPALVEANIASEHYFTAAQGLVGAQSEVASGEYTVGELRPVTEIMVPLSLRLMTICVLVLRNGFTVHGVSSVANPENFNEGIGRKVARENAVRDIWPLMGYQLRTQLAIAAMADADFPNFQPEQLKGADNAQA